MQAYLEKQSSIMPEGPEKYRLINAIQDTEEEIKKEKASFIQNSEEVAEIKEKIKKLLGELSLKTQATQ